MSAISQISKHHFRPMYAPDLPKILEIERTSYQFPWPIRIFNDCLNMGYSCWVLEKSQHIIGYGIISVDVGECHVLNLCIHPKWQRQGNGFKLLNFLMGIAHQHTANVALLEVRPSNISGLNLYRNAGFRKIGVRKNYYPQKNGREDAIILSRSLLLDTKGRCTV